jgi:hypothetical protein
MKASPTGKRCPPDVEIISFPITLYLQDDTLLSEQDTKRSSLPSLHQGLLEINELVLCWLS